MIAQYNSSDFDIKDLVKQDSACVVEHLLAADMNYWEAIKKDVIYPFLKPSTTYGRRIRDKNIDRDEVYDYVFEELVIKQKLTNLRNKSYVLSFIIERVKTYIRAKFERKKNTCGGSKESPKQSTPVVISIDAVEGGIERFLPFEKDDFEENQIRYDYLHNSFGILWEQNPRRAIVLLLKYVNGLSAREIKSFMDLASENYVNQVAKLAKGDMREIFLSVESTLNK